MEIEVSLKNAWINKPGSYYAAVYFKQNGNKIKGEFSRNSAIKVEDNLLEWQVGPWLQPVKAVKTFSFGDLQLSLKTCCGSDKVEIHIDLYEEDPTPIQSTSAAKDTFLKTLRGSGCFCPSPHEVLHFKSQNIIPSESFNSRIFIHSNDDLGGVNVNVGWISIVNQVKQIEKSDEQKLFDNVSMPQMDIHPERVPSLVKERETTSPIRESTLVEKPTSPVNNDVLMKSTVSNPIKAEDNFPSLDAVRKILPLYHRLLRSPPQSRSCVKSYVNIEEPALQKSNREEVDNVLNKISSHSESLLNGDLEKAKFLDSHVISVMEYQTKELDRYRLAVGQMGDVIVELRREISELKIKNSQLRAKIYYTDDIAVDDYEAENLAISGANTSHSDVLKRSLSSKTEEIEQQRERIRELQNSLIKANEYEKKYLQLRKAHELQQSVLQESQSKISKYRLLEKTCKDQEKIIEELEKRGEIPNGGFINGPAKRSKVHFEDSTRKRNKTYLSTDDEALATSYQVIPSVTRSTRSKENFIDFDIEDRLTLLQKLEKAEGRIMALENQASKNARTWAKEKSQFRLRMTGDFSDTMINRDVYAPPLPPLTDRADRYDNYFMVPQGRLERMEMNPRYHYL